MAMTAQPTPAPTNAAVDGLIERESRDVFAGVKTVASVDVSENFGSSDDCEVSSRSVFWSMGGCEGTFRYAPPQHFLASKVSAAGQAMTTSTLASLPAFSTASSLEELPDCWEGEDVEPTVDLKHWGIDGLYRFGYRLEEVIGDLSAFVAVDGESPDRGATAARERAPTKAMLHRATRLADGRAMFVKCVTSSGELPAAAKQDMLNEFKALRALRGRGGLVAEALLFTRFDAWLILDGAAGFVVEARRESGGNPGTDEDVGVVVQLLEALACLAPPTKSCDEVAPEQRQREGLAHGQQRRPCL